MSDKKKCNPKKKENQKIDELINKEQEELLMENQELQDKIKKLELEINKSKEIVANTQNQYVNLKADFESLRHRMENEKKSGETKYLLDTIGKFIPFVEQLRKSCENIPENICNDGWTKGILLSYQDMIKKLSDMGIFMIDSIGEEPNHEYHEPIGTLPTENKKLKGKIVNEFEKGFIYKNNGTEIVIKASKVLIGV